MIDARYVACAIFRNCGERLRSEWRRAARDLSRIKPERGENAERGEHFSGFMRVFGKRGERAKKSPDDWKERRIMRLTGNEPEQKARDARRSRARSVEAQPCKPILLKDRSGKAPALPPSHEHHLALNKRRKRGGELRAGSAQSLCASAH